MVGVLRLVRLAVAPVIPMIMNREIFFLVSILVSFVLGALFAAVRLRRR